MMFAPCVTMVYSWFTFLGGYVFLNRANFDFYCTCWKCMYMCDMYVCISKVQFKAITIYASVYKNAITIFLIVQEYS